MLQVQPSLVANHYWQGSTRNDKRLLLKVIKGHSRLWERADLDTSFLILKRVHPNLKSKYV